MTSYSSVAYFLNLAVADLRAALTTARGKEPVNQHQVLIISDTIEALLDIIFRDYPEFWGPYNRDGTVVRRG